MATEHIKDVLQRVMAKIEERHANPNTISGVPSGIEALDWITDGFQKELYILGARTSMGKSALGKDFIMAGAFAGHSMHLINIEDSNNNTVTRQLSATAGVELWKLKKGKATDSEISKMYQKCGDMASLHITFEDCAYDLKMVKQSLEDAINRDVSMVIVDYLQLIRGNHQKKRLELLQDISQLLKHTSKHIPIMAMVQINRETEKRKDRRPTMSDIRECGDIEQDADVIMLLYRDSYYSKDHLDKSAELIIAKGRNCGTGMVNMYFNDLTSTFSEELL